MRRLFNSLEFRTLLERLEDVERAAKPKVEAAALDVRAGSAAELYDLLSKKGPKAVYPSFDDGVGGLAISMGGGQALYVPFERMPDDRRVSGAVRVRLPENSGRDVSQKERHREHVEELEAENHVWVHLDTPIVKDRRAGSFPRR